MPARDRELNKLWETLSHKVLACVLVDHSAAFPVLDVLGQAGHWFHPRTRGAWLAVLRCVQESALPTPEAVASRDGGALGYLQTVAGQWNDEDSSKIVYHANDLKTLGALAQVREIGREAAGYTDPGDVAANVEYLLNRLGGVLQSTTSRDGNGAAVGAAAWEQIQRFQGRGIPTGLAWLDRITGGFWPGMNVWVAGAYKKGKTTLLRNCVLHALENGHAVDVFCAEGSREMFTLDCQAMIATRLLCEWGERNMAKLRLSGLFIMRVWREGAAVLRKEELDAVGDARRIWDDYNVRVWDTGDAIRDLAVLRHRIQRSRLEHGTQAAWCDYSQLFGRGEKLFDRQSRTALAVQEIAAGEGVVVAMLTQRNEAAIHAPGGYSVGVKGGGDASAAADFLLVPDIDHDQPGVYRVSLKHSRHTGLGKGEHAINPSSGLLLDRWFGGAT